MRALCGSRLLYAFACLQFAVVSCAGRPARPTRRPAHEPPRESPPAEAPPPAAPVAAAPAPESGGPGRGTPAASPSRPAREPAGGAEDAGAPAADEATSEIRTIEPVDYEETPTETVDTWIPILDEKLVGPKRPRLKKDAVEFPLGGERGVGAVLGFNIPLLKRLLLRPDDLREATVRFKLKGKKGNLNGAKLDLHRMLRPLGKNGLDALDADTDYEAKPFKSLGLSDVIRDGWLVLPDMAAPLQNWASGRWPDHGALARVTSPGRPPEVRLVRHSSPGHHYWQRERPHIAVTVASWEKPFIYDWSPTPREGVYNRLVDGDFDYGGERLRLWGVCRGASHNPKQVHRLRHMGFNAVRLWSGSEYTDESAKRGELAAEKMVQYDKYVAEMKKNGLWVMCPTLMSNPCGIGSARKGLFADDSWLAPRATNGTTGTRERRDWEEWKKAVGTKGAPVKFFYYFDERLRRIRKKHAENFLSHVNPYTGRRYAEEEAIALYEIFNENGLLKWVLEGGFGGWPPYFREKLRKQWNEWLREKYKSDRGLLAAWGELDSRQVIPKENLYSSGSARKGDGLRAEYFGTNNLRDLKLTRLDERIDFEFGKGSPAPGKVGSDNFSIRWTGFVAPERSGRHTFYTRTDDGVRLWVDGKLVIDQWKGQAPTEYQATLDLRAGRKYPVKMEYMEHAGGACASLSWSVKGRPVESLKAGGVKLAPLHGQRKSYPERRARDFVRFVIETVDDFNRDFTAYCRTLAPEGVGVNVVPFSNDTQYRDNTPWLYADSRGDVVCFGMYYHQMVSSLDGPPGMGGMDSNTVKDKAVVLYEVNTGHPNPYRSEFPLRLAALASWQDWDGVFFHYWQEPYWYWKLMNPEEQYLLEALPYGFNTADVMIETDPAYCTAAALAGQVFRNQSIPDAPAPRVYRVGAEAIFGYSNFGGVWMKDATYDSGSRVEFRPDLDEGITVDGAPPPEGRKTTRAVKTGPHMLWDWPKGRLVVDAPAAKMYVGKPPPSEQKGQHRFSDGLVLDGFETAFVVWAMVADDGLPIVPKEGEEGSKRIKIGAVWNNLNTGYEIDPKMIGRRGFVHPGERMKAVRNKGRPPVVADIVPYRVQFPTELDYVFRGYDFALRKRREIRGRNVNSLTHDGRELHMGILEITRRGEKAEILPEDEVPADVRIVTAGRERAERAAAPGRRRAKAPGVWSPVPGLEWDATYAEAHEFLRGPGFVMASMSPSSLDEAKRAPPDASIMLREARIVWNLPADIEIAFTNGRMSRITVSFRQAPAITEVVADYTARFGQPVEKVIAETAFQTSDVQWRKAAGAVVLEVALKEHQGSMRIVYELEGR